ncbi:MarR family winged helix-turn-helix transcriptional regulator [Acetatifactor aquisgranensis]|uniref:MarR family winged helix-turn-helix transcriptional regulator n=1 Tax=Acetatifactor aquisgranensis TaxID=2941233 RepID=UPI00203DDC24|nr:MarR family transcriptional regulator [Acetatifactor aquisgranensis]MCI8543341.1 MarR family transcriptional regulator [Lachnospiraceae bacterium]
MKGYTTAEMKRFNYLISETNAVYHEAAQKLGLSDSTQQVLYTICNNGDSCLISDICRLSGISKQTINSALRKLEGEGIVYLEASDGRKKRVCLTERGKKLAEDTVVKLIEIENGLLDSWSREELEQYLGLTQRYLDSLRAKVQELRARGAAGSLADMEDSADTAETGGADS